MSPARWLDEHHAYLDLMLRLAGEWDGRFDVVHNHSLHHLPIAMARAVRIPMVSTLHTPPTPWLESAIQVGDGARSPSPRSARTPPRRGAASCPTRASSQRRRHRAVAGGPGRRTAGVVRAHRAREGRRTSASTPRAARAGRCVLAGPVADRAYFDREVRPRLGGGARYAGHLDHAELVELVGQARAVLVTPCWDEPYGLVAAEALACGTPVCGFARGGMTEVVGPDCRVLVDAGDVDALATRHRRSRSSCRAHASREHAVRHCSLAKMVDAYTELYGELATPRVAA